MAWSGRLRALTRVLEKSKKVADTTRSESGERQTWVGVGMGVRDQLDKVI